MPTPWSPFLGPPWTFTISWAFAQQLAQDRATTRQSRQKVEWSESEKIWLISDTS